MSKHETLSIYDYNRRKICDLYDSNIEMIGQAYEIIVSRDWDGRHSLTFKLPYMVTENMADQDIDAAIFGVARFGRSMFGQAISRMGNRNYRWMFLKSDYLIRYTCGAKKIWFVADKPKRVKTAKSIYGDVSCNGYESLMKTRGIYQTFDDENGIGTIDYLITQILRGTGWTYDAENSEKLFERDGVTEKVRSLISSDKKGTLNLITTTCNLFQARPIYDTDKLTVTIKAMSSRDQVLEGEVGRNLTALTASEDSSDIATRVYVEGEYGDFGYVGIDDVKVNANGELDPNGTAHGLPFILNFDYYRDLGVFTSEHETALNTYLTQIRAKKAEISANGHNMIVSADTLNTMIGQCQLAVYYKSDSLVKPKYTYGGITGEQATLNEGDEVYLLLTNGRYEKTKWVGASQLDSAYGVAKFVTPSSGYIGAKEVQVEAKQQQIDNLQRKITQETKPDKIAEYVASISQLTTEINELYLGGVVIGDDEKKMKASVYMPTDYKGKVDLTNRRIVRASSITSAGWTGFQGTYGTIYSTMYSAGAGNDYDFLYFDNVIIVATPIRADGTVMTPAQLESYISGVVTNANNNYASVYQYDTQGMILNAEPIKAGETIVYAFHRVQLWIDDLDKKQKDWDVIRAKYNFFGETGIDPTGIFNSTPRIYAVGLYDQMNSVMKSDGLLYEYDLYTTNNITLNNEQDDIEGNFITAMGYMLRDGYWNNENYAVGQEDYLYLDAQDISEKMAHPKATYTFSYVRVTEDFDIPPDEIDVNAIFRIYDAELGVDANLYVKKVSCGVDDKSKGSIEVSTDDTALTNSDLGALLSRIAQLADLVDQKNTLFERAKALTEEGTLYVSRLEGQIDVMRNRILSSSSNWYTDENGNIVFNSADGQSAMMLSGAGFMIANSKDDSGQWRWRTFGTGEGFTADEIIAGFIGADRIESGSISTDKLQAGAVTASKIEAGAISSDKLQADAVTATKIAANAITSEKIVTGSVTGDKIAANAVTAQKLSADAVTASKIAAGAVTTEKIDAHAITASKIDIEDLFADQATISQLQVAELYNNQSIKTMVAGKNQTYIQLNDPTVEHEVNVGDWWCKSDLSTWRQLGPKTWREIKEQDLGDLMGGETFVWDGVEWVPRSNIAEEARNRTMIEQTQSYIQLLATTINSYYGRIEELQAEFLLTSSQISSEVRRAKNAESQKVAITGNYQTAESIVNAAYTFTNSQLTHYSTTEQTASMISSTVSNALSVYSTTDQTASMISAYVTNHAYGIVSGIEITASGVSISGSQYVKIASGGYFQVTTGDFGINSNANTLDYVIWAGGSTPGSSNFRVKKNGYVYVTKLVTLGEDDTEQVVNLSAKTAGLWKLSYHTVKAVDDKSITLSNGTVINFNSASSLSIIPDGAGNVVIYSSSWNELVAGTSKRVAVAYNQQGSPSYTSGYTHVPVKVFIDGSQEVLSTEVYVSDGSGDGLAYDAGKTAGINSVTITDISKYGDPAGSAVEIPLQATASNGQTYIGSVNITTQRNNAANSVSVTGVERQSGNTFSSNKKTVYFNVRGTASNGNTGEWVQVSANVTDAYNKGWNDCVDWCNDHKHSARWGMESTSNTLYTNTSGLNFDTWSSSGGYKGGSSGTLCDVPTKV